MTCDFSVLRRELPVLAGLPADSWNDDYNRFSPMLNDGRMTKADAFTEILRTHGRDPRPGLIRDLVAADAELLLANSRLFDDAVPFLENLRARGVKIAIVSNCTENTRPMLTAFGVDALADTMVLSCEVRAAKPAAEIFLVALARLGVAAGAAVFVDDHAGFCAGGVAVGLTVLQIVRGELDGRRQAAGATLIRSLSEVEALWTPA